MAVATRKTAKRTKRLIELLNHDDVHVHWSDDLVNSQGWKIIHTAFGRKSVLILDMGESGYQLYPIDTNACESVNSEVSRLAL